MCVILSETPFSEVDVLNILCIKECVWKMISTIFVCGICGSGKTTIAYQLAKKYGFSFLEADDFHTDVNRRKMSEGLPLTDADRTPWLVTIFNECKKLADSGRTVVVPCSALKRSYRHCLMSGSFDPRVAPALSAFFVQLGADAATVQRRMEGRGKHFMPTSLIASQLATLEPLGPGEPGVVVDGTLGVEEIVRRVSHEMGLS